MPFTFTKTSSTCHFHLEYALNCCTRFRLISEANIGPNLFHQYRTASWLTSMPRSCSRSSTFRSERGKRMYSITARRMISGLVLKYLKEAGRVMGKSYATTLPRSSKVLLTRPASGCVSCFPRLRQANIRPPPQAHFPSLTENRQSTNPLAAFRICFHKSEPSAIAVLSSL